MPEHAMHTTTGQRIVSARLHQGMTQEQLAQKMGTVQAAISRWETDQRLPHLQNLKPLADALDVTVESLLPGTHPIAETVSTNQLLDIATTLENTAAAIRRIFDIEL